MQQDICWPESVAQLIAELRDLLATIDQETTRVAKTFAYRCETGCGRCCITPHIEAMPIEMLAAAQTLLENGQENAVYSESSLPCPLYQPKQPDTPEYGACRQYQDRPSVCRLFGYSFRALKSDYRLALCRLLKESYPHLQTVTYHLEQPLIQTNQLSLQLRLLGPSSLSQPMPIREALKTAVVYLQQQLAYQS